MQHNRVNKADVGKTLSSPYSLLLNSRTSSVILRAYGPPNPRGGEGGRGAGGYREWTEEPELKLAA